VIRDEVNVLWRTNTTVNRKGYGPLPVSASMPFHGSMRARGVGDLWRDNYYFYTGMNITHCDRALRDNASGIEEYKRLRQMFYTSMGNQHWRHGDFRSARQSYLVAVRDNWRLPQVWIKMLILFMGLGRTAVSSRSLQTDGAQSSKRGPPCSRLSLRSVRQRLR